MEKSRQNTALVLLKEVAFNRESEVLKEEIKLQILGQDPYEPIYINDFLKMGKYQKVRKILDELVKDGLLIKIKAYPVFYERVELEKIRKRRLFNAEIKEMSQLQ